MKIIQAILGYAIAACCIIIVIATFVGMDSWCQLLVEKTGLVVSPWITGDEIVETIDHDTYKTQIHKPVFQWLFSERREGFVQVEWVKEAELPEQISEDIDFDNDGTTDFSIDWAGKNRVTLTTYDPRVLSVDSTYELEDSYVVRVALVNSK